MPERQALILIDHGSRRDAANAMLFDMAEVVRRCAGERFALVEVAHMELAEPTLEDAFVRCVEAGASTIVVGLFFLSPGRHSRSDIPAMVEALQQRFPAVEAVVSDPLGVDEKLAELLLLRAEQALAQVPPSEQG